MKLAFWRREPEPEKRANDFTGLNLSAILAQAGSNGSDVAAVGALEMAAGAYSRAFAGATVKRAGWQPERSHLPFSAISGAA